MSRLVIFKGHNLSIILKHEGVFKKEFCLRDYTVSHSDLRERAPVSSSLNEPVKENPEDPDFYFSATPVAPRSSIHYVSMPPFAWSVYDGERPFA